MPLFRIYNDKNILCVTVPEMVECGIVEDTIKKGLMRHRQEKVTCWPHHKEGNTVYIHFDGLKKNYQDIISLKLCGGKNVHDYATGDAMDNYLVSTARNETELSTYKKPDGRSLRDEEMETYRTAVKYLNMLAYFDSVEKVTRVFGMSKGAFKQMVITRIKEQGISLPSDYSRLQEKLREYKAKGATVVIPEGRFNNTNSKKIGKKDGQYSPELDQKIRNLILEAASRPNNFNKTQITRAVNMVLKGHAIEPLSYANIYRILRTGEAQALHTAGAKGLREFNVRQSMHVKRSKPTRPMLFVSVDGWTAELLYQDGGSYTNRMVVVVVMDPFNNYPLGYAIGERENIELIKAANRNAIQHAAELFGDLYCPWQIQSDNYGIKALRPFYEGMSQHFTPAAVGNAKAKPVEPYFSYLNKEYCQWMPNWSGFNLTAKQTNQPNAEWLDRNKKNLPGRQEVIRQIEGIIEMDRQKKAKAYIDAFFAATSEHKMIITKENYYYILGESTLPNRVQPMGITPKIGGQKLYFDTFDSKLRELSHLKFSIHYDPANTSEALAVSECGNYRMLVNEKYEQPMALAERQEGDSDELQRVRNFNKTRKDRLTQKRIAAMSDAQELIESADQSALLKNEETALKLMFTYNGQQKEAIQNAKRLGTSKPQIPVEITSKEIERKAEETRAKSIQEQHEEYLNSKIDFDQYLD